MPDRKVYKSKTGIHARQPMFCKWKLAATPIDYEHSWARFYVSSKHAPYEITNVDEVLKIFLNNSAETIANTQGQE